MDNAAASITNEYIVAGLIGAFILTFIVWWLSFIRALLKDNQGNSFFQMISNETAIKLSVAMMSILAVLILSVIGKLSSEAVAIISGVVGYVLGNAGKKIS